MVTGPIYLRIYFGGPEIYNGKWEPYKPGGWRVPEKLAWNLTPQQPENDPAVLERVEKIKDHVYRIELPRQWFSSGHNPFLAVNLPHRHNHERCLRGVEINWQPVEELPIWAHR